MSEQQNPKTARSAFWAAVKSGVTAIWLATMWVVFEVIVPVTVWVARWFVGCVKSFATEREFRRGVAFTSCIVVIAVVVVAVMQYKPWEAHGWWSDDCQETVSPNGEPAHITRIREARARLRSFDSSILSFATKQYNIHVASEKWVEGAKRCLTFREEFRQVEVLTGYPAELIAGIALHESDGCRQGARDWAGGRGLMQITHISQRRHVAPVAKMLGVDESEVDYRGNTLHNLLVGVMVLDDYERSLGSRAHGLLAYNMGVGGVKGTVKRMGRSMKKPPTISSMRHHLKYTRKMKPRVYVEKVLASVAMMNMVMDGRTLQKVSSLRFKDIPGWDPSRDAQWPVPIVTASR